MRHHFLCFAAVVAITAPVAAQAEDETARVGLDVMGGFVEDDSELTGPDNDKTYAFLPSVAFGNSLVVQVDGIAADHRTDTVAGVAVHAGLRVGPKVYAGAYGSRSENNRHSGLAIYRAGGEVDFDLGALDISSVAGYEHTQGGSFLIRTTSTDNVFDMYDGDERFFAFSDIGFQPTDQYRISVGHRYNGGEHSLAIGSALGLTRNFAIFAEARVGERDNNGGFIGLRGRFGGGNNGSSLLNSRLMEDLFTTSNIRSTLGVPLPPPEDDGDNGCCGGYCEG